jgi:RNA polymerase-binding transcription factor DksA
MARATKPAKTTAKKAAAKSTSRSSAAKSARSAKTSKTKATKTATTRKTATTTRSATTRKTAKSAKKPAAKKVATSTRKASAPARKAARKKAPDDKFLVAQLKALQEERATYTRQAASLRAEADLLAAEREPGDVQFDEESGEGDTLQVERERDLALSAQASAAVEEIDLAIEKIQSTGYGVCDRCGKDIPRERLRALPYAALCVTCKSAGFSRR